MEHAEIPLVSHFDACICKNDLDGWIGMAFTVGAESLTVTALGRLCLEGNERVHTLKLVRADDGFDFDGARVEVDMSAGRAGEFLYGKLEDPVELAARETYYLVSDERRGGDAWHHLYTTVAGRRGVRLEGAVYNLSRWTTVQAPHESYGPVSFLYLADPDTPVTRPPLHREEAVAWRERGDDGRRLEPRGDAILHGAGQSDDAFAAYRSHVGAGKPLLYMTYCGLREISLDWFAQLGEKLSHYPEWLLPQIGLSMTRDGQPEQRYEHQVADGEFDSQIETLCLGLSRLNRPAYLRIGYEFNGPWNGYRPDPYRRAWIRIEQALRRVGLDQIATVWCYAPEGSDKDFAAYYPGDGHVDWWSIDLFTAADFRARDTIAFVEEAQRSRFPVMIGESTPRAIGVAHGQTSWRLWFAPYFRFIREHSCVKAFCYIDWDWDQYHWKWGDARIEAEPAVLANYRAEMEESPYLHADAESGIRHLLHGA